MLDRRVETILIVRGAELLNQMRECMGASDEMRRTMSRCAITLMAVASHARWGFGAGGPQIVKPIKKIQNLSLIWLTPRAWTRWASFAFRVCFRPF